MERSNVIYATRDYLEMLSESQNPWLTREIAKEIAKELRIKDLTSRLSELAEKIKIPFRTKREYN